MTLLKNFALTLLLGFSLSACDGSSSSSSSAPSDTTEAPVIAADSITDIAASNPDFSQLVSLLQATGLDATLGDASGTFTVFAPTNAAFESLGQDTLDALAGDTDALSNILLYHVLNTEVDAAGATAAAGTTLETANGDALAITAGGSGVGIRTNFSSVTAVDIAAVNGVIHVIDAVMLPPTETDASSASITEFAALDGNFNTLVAALQSTGLDAVLDSSDATYTVFAPTDEAFAAVGEANLAALIGDTDALTGVLLQHVLEGAVDSVTAMSLAGTSVATAGGNDVAIDIMDGALKVGGSTVTVTNILASNGIIHVIDAVILGDDSDEPSDGDDGGSGDGDGGGATVDIASNGGFEDGLTGWVYTDGAVAIENDGDNYAAATVTDAGNVWDVNISQILELEPSAQYTLSFSARATEARTIVVGIGLNYPPWYANVEEVTLSTEWAEYTLVLDAIDGGTGEAFGDADNRIIFDLGAAVGNVHIDNVSLLQSGGSADDEYVSSPSLEGFSLVWQDEFDGSELNVNDWNYEFGDGTEFDLPPGWGNDELQIYTTNAENVSLGVDGDASVLKITAREDGNGGYTSARITTEDKVSVRYGKIVARIKLPETQGIWPAFWLLGDNIDEVSWPGAGEIDVVELVGFAPDETFHTIHYVNGEQSYNFNEGDYQLSSKFSEDYHEFMVDWTPNWITWYVDGNQAHTVSFTDDMKEFQRSFHMLLNVAVGGRFPGSPDGTSMFPQTMYVDYVRVYEQDGFSPDPAPELDLNEETVGGISDGDGNPNEAILTGFDAFVPVTFARFGAGGEPDWFDANDAVDGNYSVRFVYPGGSWGGAWMELEGPVDLTAYSESDLVFAIKKPDIVTGLEIKIEGLNPSDGSMFLENYTPTDLGNGWEEYRIPLADFIADGLLLDQIVIPFALWNPMAADGSFPEVDILFDAIRFE